MWTINNNEKMNPLIVEERQKQLNAIVEANYEIEPPEIKLSTL